MFEMPQSLYLIALRLVNSENFEVGIMSITTSPSKQLAIREQYKKGCPIKEIALFFGVGTSTVEKYVSGLRMRRRMFSEQETKDIRSRHLNGEKISNLAKEYKCSRGAISYLVKNNGRISRRKLPIKEIRQRYLQGKAIKDIAEEFKIQSTRIHVALEDLDISNDFEMNITNDFEAKSEIIDLWLKYCQTSNDTMILATETFVESVKNGQLQISSRIKEFLLSKKGKFKLSRASLNIWRNQIKNI